MPPRAKRRPPSPASPMDNPTDAMEAAVRLVEELSGQEGQEDQNSPLLNFLLPPSRPRILLPTPTTPPRRRSNKRTSTPTSSSSLSARSSPSPPALIRNSDHKRAADPDQFPHQYRRLPDGSYSLVECWELHGRSRCTVSLREEWKAPATTDTSDPLLRQVTSLTPAHLIPTLQQVFSLPPTLAPLVLPHHQLHLQHLPHQLQLLIWVPYRKVGSRRPLVHNYTLSLPLWCARSSLLQ